MSKLAVILPVYKNDKLDYLKQSVNSLEKQTLKDFLIYIFIDGPVHKEIYEYLKSIESKTIILHNFNVNKGLPSVLNKGIELCIKNGIDYIARMDADDLSHENRFIKQIDYLERNKEVMALGTEAFIIDSKGKTIGRKKVVSKLTLNVLKKKSDIVHPSVIFRSVFFEKIGTYNQDLIQAQDYDLWFRAINNNLKVESLNECLYYLRYDNNLVARRKKAQKYVLQSKRKYLKKRHFIYLLPQIMIILIPKFLLKRILFNKVRKELKN